MESQKGLRLVEKTVEVVNLLADREEMTIAQLAEETGEPRSSLYRLLRRLEEFELVEPAGTRGHFRLGTHLLRWGAAAQSGMNVRKRALATMGHLRSETGLTVFLVVRRGWRAVCVERLEGNRVASLVLQLGGWLPLHTGASPRALLAFEEREFWESYVNHNTLDRMTDRTPATAKGLYDLLAAEREQGYCVSDGHVVNGIASLGAPILDHQGKVLAAVSVSGLRDEVVGESQVDRIRSLVLEAADTISHAMGGIGPASRAAAT
ncbi:MAG: helix-turn-helix domain-containing protein [Propionibacteriales bacterium]|nr:helix-turn-helix domain-containing protein [Propionibacteriales bacterium]